jgi:hypothetical protein
MHGRALAGVITRHALGNLNTNDVFCCKHSNRIQGKLSVLYRLKHCTESCQMNIKSLSDPFLTSEFGIRRQDILTRTYQILAKKKTETMRWHPFPHANVLVANKVVIKVTGYHYCPVMEP